MFKKSRLMTAAALLSLGAAASFGGVAHADGGGATQATLTGGSLTVSGGAPGSFSATLNGANQTADTTLGNYTVNDATGSAAGWNVTFQATQFTCAVQVSGVGDAGCQPGLTTLPADSLSIAKPTAACASGSTCTGSPAVSITGNTAVDGASAVTVLDAAAGTGMGSYDVTPGTIGAGQLQLAIPGNALATTYHSTLTITVNSGP